MDSFSSNKLGFLVAEICKKLFHQNMAKMRYFDAFVLCLVCAWHKWTESMIFHISENWFCSTLKHKNSFKTIYQLRIRHRLANEIGEIWYYILHKTTGDKNIHPFSIFFCFLLMDDRTWFVTHTKNVLLWLDFRIWQKKLWLIM